MIVERLWLLHLWKQQRICCHTQYWALIHHHGLRSVTEFVCSVWTSCVSCLFSVSCSAQFLLKKHSLPALLQLLESELVSTYPSVPQKVIKVSGLLMSQLFLCYALQGSALTLWGMVLDEVSFILFVCLCLTCFKCRPWNLLARM